MQFLDPQHPFFEPLWRRVATVAAPAAWGLVELSNGAVGWAIVFIGAAAYAAYQLFVVRQSTAAGPAPEQPEAEQPKMGDEQ